MSRKLYLFYNCLLLFWICLMYSIGVWLFANGFILIRNPIETKSSCHDSDKHLLSSIEKSDSLLRSNTPGCGFANRYERAIVLLIDHLFFDLTAIDTIDSNEDNLFVINNIYNKYSNQSKVFRLSQMASISWIQTIKSIITGGLQTFMEINCNYKPNDIIEDNLINQLNSKSKRITLVTDKSVRKPLKGLFNKIVYFDRERSDLRHKLIKQIESNDWNLLISHIETIHQFQQSFGSKNPKTLNQFQQINDMLEKIISVVNKDNTTILFIIGDSSEQQTSDLIKRSPFVLSFGSQNLLRFETSIESIKKIDLVPTISLLLGIPIPFSNMGRVLSSLFEFPMDCKSLKSTPEFTCHEDISEIQSLWTSISAVRINVAQMQRYVNTYSQSWVILPNVIQRQLEELLERYDRNWVLLNHIPSDDKLARIQSLKELRNNYEHYISQLTNQMILNFVASDNRFLFSGLIVLFLSCFANITAIYCMSCPQNLIKFCSKILIGSIMGVITSNLIRFINYSFHENSLNDILFLTAVTSIVVSVGSILLPKSFKFMSKERRILKLREINKKVFSFETLFICLFIIFSIFSFSKTLIKSEESIIHFIFQSLLISFLFDINFCKLSAIKQTSNQKLIIVLSLSLAVLSRLLKELHRCYEQQTSCPYVRPVFESLVSNQSIISSLFSILVLIYAFYYLKGSESSDVLSLSNTFSKYLIVINSLSFCCHSVLSLANPLIREKLLSGNELSVAKTVLYSNVLLIVLMFVFPLQINSQKCSDSEPNYKRLFISLFLLISSLLNSLFLFKDETSNMSLMLFCIFIAIYSHLMSKINYSNSFVSIILWYLFAINGFFSTGHYYSIDSIPQNILFMSESTDFWSYVIPIILNKYSVWILSAISLPLFVLKVNSNQDNQYFWKSFSNISLKYIFLNGFTLSVTSLSSGLMKNDLMIWRIFGIRFVHQMIGLLIGFISICLSFAFSLKIYFHSNY